MDKAERRQQILNHARDVFAKRGYYAAKIDDIVSAAGIARGQVARFGRGDDEAAAFQTGEHRA